MTGSDQDGMPARPITILDYVRAVTGDKPSYTGEDYWHARVAFFGLALCETCPAIMGAATAYPARSGFWRCADCIGDDGYATAEEFAATLPADA